MTNNNHPFTTVTIDHIQHWSDGLFTLHTTRPQHFQFIPGQYARLAMMIDGSDEPIIRPYSIASTPDGDTLEFYLSAPENSGILSSHLVQLQPGDELLVDLNQAYGYLTLAEVPDAANLWLLASGVGLAPFLSIVRSAEVYERFQNIILAHSVRYLTELGYAQELQQLHNNMAGLTYLPFVTRQSPPDTNNADTHAITQGRITTALHDGTLEQLAQTELTATDSHIMICGNPGLIDDCTSIGKSRGLTRHRRRSPGQITVEKFW